MMWFENVPIQLVDTPPLDRGFVEPALFDLVRRTDMILLLVDIQANPFEQLEIAVSQLVAHRIVPAALPAHLLAQHLQVVRPVVLPLLVLVNKCDDRRCSEDYQAFNELLEGGWPLLPISVESGYNLEELKRRVFEQLDLIRVYTRAPGKEPDRSKPFILKRGARLEELAGKIHKDFLTSLKSARVWGVNVFDGQLVPREYVLQEGDVVELRV
jgi:hypothetical protein